jgi:hypothetical protein
MFISNILHMPIIIYVIRLAFGFPSQTIQQAFGGVSYLALIRTINAAHRNEMQVSAPADWLG